MKKNLLKKLFLTSVSFFTVAALVGCKDKKTAEEAKHSYFDGNPHELNATDTDKFMVQNGATEYKIIIPRTADDILKIARDEFIYFFAKATGITLAWTYDREDLKHEKNQKFVSIGETSLFNTSGVEINKLELGNDGIIIKTVDDNIYLIGGSNFGSLYSVYDFMEICFHYEQYSHKIMEIDTDVRTLPLKNFNVKDIPDIPMRCHSYGFMGTSASDYDQKMFGYRCREDRIRNDHRFPIHQTYSKSSPSAKSTNSNTVIDYALYGGEHPDWFSINSGSGRDSQWCYTARGNKAEYDLFVKEVAHKITFSLETYTPENYPTFNCALIMMEDNFNTCTCEACAEAKAKYGADSGAVVVFMNKVCDLVLAWEEEHPEYKREDLKICFNAYNAFEDSPTVFNEEKGIYEPVCDEVIMNEHLGVYFAEINNLDNQQSFFSEMNANGKAMFDGWAALTNWLEFWVYETDFRDACYFYDSFAFSTQEFYNYIAAKGVKLIFSQGIDTDGHGGWTGICWNQLKAYLNRKLTWNSNLNQDELVNNWFKAMYKDASQSMRKLFNSMRSYYAYLLDTNPGLRKLRSIYNVFSNTSYNYYPIQTLESFIAIVDEAHEKIARYKDNPEFFVPIDNEIEAQAIFPLFAELELHSSELNPVERNRIIDRLITAISNLDLSSCVVRESGSTLLSRVESYR